MRIIVNDQYYSTVDGASMQITGSTSDPVPTCTVNVIDNASSISIAMYSEIIVIDDQVYPNPTLNLLQNPSLNPFNVQPWTRATGAGSGSTSPTLSQTGGGGMTAAFNTGGNGAGEFASITQETIYPRIIAGTTYCFSFTTSGSSISNMELIITIVWSNIAGTISTTTTTIPSITNATTRQSLTSVAPAGALQATVTAQAQATSAGVSGSVVTFTQMQFEAEWFPTLSYPTPWCGPSQTNCQQLPLGWWIRQYRKFAGFVVDIQPGSYHGNVRTLVLNCSGYAWLAGTYLGNDAFSSKTDAQIITTLLAEFFVMGTYPLSTLLTGAALTTTTNVVPVVTVASQQLNWDFLRTIFDSLCSLSGNYWTIDPYWNFVYAPPTYFSSGITLIGDNSSQPDMVTSFPFYGFQAEIDGTQPGSTILVIGGSSGGTTFTAEVIDPAQTANLGQATGYYLPTGKSWMRKVSDSTLLSNADCTQRGIGELLLYDQPREIYQLTTNQELIAGYGVSLTSATDGLSSTTLLVQQVQAKWIGTNNPLTDIWEYTATLGAVNRTAINILSRISRATQSSDSAPAINVTSLATIENVGVLDTIDSNSLYAENVLAKSPSGYWRLGEPAGFSITTAYDWSGNGNNGTINGAVTLGQAGAIYNDPNTAMLFDGATGQINATGLSTTGLSALSLEAWVKLSTLSFTNARIFSNSQPGSTNAGCELVARTGGVGIRLLLGNGTTFLQLDSTFAMQAGVWYHVVGVWSAAGGAAIYINAGTALATGTLTGTIAAAAATLAIGYAPTVNSNFFPGLIDEAAAYSGTRLSQAQVQADYNFGTLGHA